MNATHHSRVRPAAAAILSASMLIPMTGGARAAQAEQLGPNIVANGGFESGAKPDRYLKIESGSPLLNNWEVTNNGWVAVVGADWQAQEGARSLALATFPGSKDMSTVKQTLTTKAGQRYQVVFYQAGNPSDHKPSTLRIQIGSLTKDFTFQADSTIEKPQMQWVKRSLVYTATAASTPLVFSAQYTQQNYPLGLDNVQVRGIQDNAGAQPAAARTTLRITSPSITAGGKQTVQVSAGKSASLALVIDYPDGTQAVTPTRTGADGTYSYSWTLGAGVHGKVQITAVSAGSIAQGSFQVS